MITIDQAIRKLRLLAKLTSSAEACALAIAALEDQPAAFWGAVFRSLQDRERSKITSRRLAGVEILEELIGKADALAAVQGRDEPTREER